MEHRIVLTTSEAAKLSKELIFIEPAYIRDEYTGTQRKRTKFTQTEPPIGV